MSKQASFDLQDEDKSWPAGFRHLSGYFDARAQLELVAAVRDVIAYAPLFTPRMPKTGKPMSVRMTNCGPLGWVTDKARGYRYQPMHPETCRAWPAIPSLLLDLWRNVCDFPAWPEACLINYYSQGARMGSHVDADEACKEAPVLSVSLGDTAAFHLGGLLRSDPKRRKVVKSGDVIVLGGAARLAYHGIDKVHSGSSQLLDEGGRINLTLRRVTKPAA